ncbi:hypothetical protein KBC03_02360 [Patescibacteria group bacterium]|nr:hypothetical protein [Patescibacteria group bacterium]
MESEKIEPYYPKGGKNFAVTLLKALDVQPIAAQNESFLRTYDQYMRELTEIITLNTRENLDDKSILHKLDNCRSAAIGLKTLLHDINAELYITLSFSANDPEELEGITRRHDEAIELWETQRHDFLLKYKSQIPEKVKAEYKLH